MCRNTLVVMRYNHINEQINRPTSITVCSPCSDYSLLKRNGNIRKEFRIGGRVKCYRVWKTVDKYINGAHLIFSFTVFVLEPVWCASLPCASERTRGGDLEHCFLYFFKCLRGKHMKGKLHDSHWVLFALSTEHLFSSSFIILPLLSVRMKEPRSCFEQAIYLVRLSDTIRGRDLEPGASQSSIQRVL